MLATMPHWYREGYEILLHLPVISYFRAPGRYTLLTSLCLCLLAGRGFDRSLARRRFWTGYALIVIIAAVATAWGVAWSSRPEVAASLARGMREPLIIASVMYWIVALGAVAAWRLGTALTVGTAAGRRRRAHRALLPRVHTLGLVRTVARRQPVTSPP